MPKFNNHNLEVGQKGLAPLIIISLVGLGLITAAGTYFVLNYAQPPVQESVAPAAQSPSPRASVTENISIEEVKAANEETLLNMEGVKKVEVGEKDGKPCVVVFTFKETDEIQNLENNGLNGYEVKIENAAETKPL